MKSAKTLAVIAITASLYACDECSLWTSKESRLIENSPEVMHVLKINVPEENEVLRAQSTDIPRKALDGQTYKTLTSKMLATVTDPTQDGVGIAAPQVGISRRIVAVQRLDKPGEPFEVYANIRITEKRGQEEAGPEGCLSVPDRYDNVLRSRDITISYTSPTTLKDTTEIIQGFTAVIFQHECDHLDGIVFTDRI